MNYSRNMHGSFRSGAVLALVLMLFVILVLLGIGLLTISYGVRVRSSRLKNEAMAMAAAEAGYEKAIFCMSKKKDILGSLGDADLAGDLAIGMSRCTYKVEFSDYIGARPVFRIVSDGFCNSAKRTVDVFVVQAVSGWDMGLCRVPSGPHQTDEVYFKDGETVDMKLHINKYDDSPDVKDIWIRGNPRFVKSVEMGESQSTRGGTDKYASVINLFEGGIIFDQPNVRITDEEAIQKKLDRFKASTNSVFVFAPQGNANISPATGFPSNVNVSSHPAVQIEFYTDASGVGMLRITNNCTVVTCGRTGFGVTHDVKIAPNSGGDTYELYGVYAYHYRSAASPSYSVPVMDTYVTQTFAGKQSEPGGQIFVTGDVILGSDAYDMVLKGKLTIVAARTGASTDDGHIWIADKIIVAGTRDAVSGMPAADNPNVLGLIAQGVVKIIDPGLSSYPQDSSEKYPGPPPGPLNDRNLGASVKHYYAPVANAASAVAYDRVLPDPMIVEAAITVGGGGWGAENVQITDHGNTHGGRRENGGQSDQLIVRGTIVEGVRGVVGTFNQATGQTIDGYEKVYYLDERLLNGALPGNIWFSGKYIPAPGGWHDYRPVTP
jgi:hypothetical protein